MLRLEITAVHAAAHPSGLHGRAQLREAMEALGFFDTIGSTASGFTSDAVNNLSVSSTDNPEPEAAPTAPPAPAPVVKRERGKPGPGRQRRSKEEVAEDEAADAEDARSAAQQASLAQPDKALLPAERMAAPPLDVQKTLEVKGTGPAGEYAYQVDLPLVPEPAQQIQTQPENREPEPETPALRYGANGEYTYETVRDALGLWVKQDGMDVVTPRFKEIIKGDKVTDIPATNDACKAVVDRILAAMRGVAAFG